jgi:hypothetical protein
MIEQKKSMPQLDHIEEQQPVRERGIWAAVMMQAVADIRLAPEKSKRTGKLYDRPEKRSAIDWMMDNRRDIFNSFVNLCELLGLDPDRVRAAVLK